MDVGSRTAMVLEKARSELGVVSEGRATLAVSTGVDTDHNGSDTLTVTLQLEDGSLFGMYSTGSAASLQAYLRGFQQALSLMAGGYAYKPLNEKAAKGKRESLTPWREESRKYRMQQAATCCASPERLRPKNNSSAKTSPRFKLARNKFKEY